jgi:hypothetical protein
VVHLCNAFVGGAAQEARRIASGGSGALIVAAGIQ